MEAYPDGSFLSEMLQNADDAKASGVHFQIDHRTYGKLKLFSPEMEGLQGPALMVHNNSQFTTQDFTNICSLGNSYKAKSAEHVGRFGLGFSAVPHDGSAQHCERLKRAVSRPPREQPAPPSRLAPEPWPHQYTQHQHHTMCRRVLCLW